MKIGSGAYIGSGSVITKDVPDNAMAVERNPQTKREGGALPRVEDRREGREGR